MGLSFYCGKLVLMQMKASGTLRYLNLLPKFILGKIVPNHSIIHKRTKNALRVLLPAQPVLSVWEQDGLLSLAVVPCVFYKPREDASLHPTRVGAPSA